MASAISEVGLEPDFHRITDPATLKHIVNGYLGAEIPLVLIGTLWQCPPNSDTLGKVPLSLPEGDSPFNFHAVAITGYATGNACLTKPTKPSEPCFSHQHIYQIYAHDDGVGPFARMPIDEKPVDIAEEYHDALSPIPAFSFKTSWKHKKVPIGQMRFLPHSLVVPLYPKIRVSFSTIIAKVGYINKLLVQPAVEADGPLSLPEDLVWDVSLTLGWRIQESAYRCSALSGNYRSKLLDDVYPRFVWKVRGSCQGKPMVDLLFDATDIDSMIYDVGYHGAIYYDPRMEQLLE